MAFVQVINTGIQVLLSLVGGWLVAHFKVLDSTEFARKLNEFILKVLAPCFSLWLIALKTDMRDVEAWRLIWVFMVWNTILQVLVAVFVVPAYRTRRARQFGLHSMVLTYNNTGIIGMVMAEAVLGPSMASLGLIISIPMFIQQIMVSMFCFELDKHKQAELQQREQLAGPLPSLQAKPEPYSASSPGLEGGKHASSSIAAGAGLGRGTELAGAITEPDAQLVTVPAVVGPVALNGESPLGSNSSHEDGQGVRREAGGGYNSADDSGTLKGGHGVQVLVVRDLHRDQAPSLGSPFACGPGISAGVVGGCERGVSPALDTTSELGSCAVASTSSDLDVKGDLALPWSAGLNEEFVAKHGPSLPSGKVVKSSKVTIPHVDMEAGLDLHALANKGEDVDVAVKWLSGQTLRTTASVDVNGKCGLWRSGSSTSWRSASWRSQPSLGQQRSMKGLWSPSFNRIKSFRAPDMRQSGHSTSGRHHALGHQMRHICMVVVCNPLLLSTIISVFLSLAGLPYYLDPEREGYVPQLGFIESTLAWFARATSPLSVFAQGLWLHGKIRQVASRPSKVCMYMALKLVLGPLLMLLLTKHSGLADRYAVGLVVMTALPVGQIAWVLCEQYKMGADVVTAVMLLGTFTMLPHTIVLLKVIDQLHLFNYK